MVGFDAKPSLCLRWPRFAFLAFAVIGVCLDVVIFGGHFRDFFFLGIVSALSLEFASGFVGGLTGR